MFDIFDEDRNKKPLTIIKNNKNNINNNKSVDIFNQDCSENDETLRKSDKNIYIFDHDCSENHEEFKGMTKKYKTMTNKLTCSTRIATKIMKFIKK